MSLMIWRRPPGVLSPRPRQDEDFEWTKITGNDEHTIVQAECVRLSSLKNSKAVDSSRVLQALAAQKEAMGH